MHWLATWAGGYMVVEELVPQGEQKRWAQMLALEVISGRRAVA
jgi:hypothetical protein